MTRGSPVRKRTISTNGRTVTQVVDFTVDGERREGIGGLVRLCKPFTV